MTQEDKKKLLGQIFTPDSIVNRILDELDYTITNDNILSAKILEPSVGQGVFLQEAVRRQGRLALAKGWKHVDIATMLSETITGFDIDPEIVSVCIHNLNKTVSKELGLTKPVEWNIFVGDALLYSPSEEKFDYIVGNPPYVRIHNMPAELRESVKQFKSSTGITDLYIIFFELGLRWLNDNGKLGYIAPNSWLKNHSQKGFRKELLTGQNISTIIDYGTYSVFGDDAATYTAVTILSKKQNNTLTYEKMLDMSTTDYRVDSDYAQISTAAGRPLVFGRKGFVGVAEGLQLKDVAQVQTGVQTSMDTVFINPDAEIEPELIRPAIKAGRHKGDITSTIFFPYYTKQAEGSSSTPLFLPEPQDEDDNKIITPFREEELRRQYPIAYQYVLRNKDKLASRNFNEKDSEWFHYGRSQGLRNIHKPKLVLSTLLSPSVRTLTVYQAGGDVVVYSGLFITKKKQQKKITPASHDSSFSFDTIRHIIESPECSEYLWSAGKDLKGGYRNFSARVINDFVIPERFVRGN